MDPTSVNEPAAAAEVALEATAMSVAANRQLVAAPIRRLTWGLEANKIDFIEAALHAAMWPDNGTSVLQVSKIGTSGRRRGDDGFHATGRLWEARAQAETH